MKILAAYDDRQMLVLSETSEIERQFLSDLGYHLKSEETYIENSLNEICAEYWQKPDVPQEFQVYMEMLDLVNQQNPYGGYDIYTKDHKFVAEYNNQKEKWNIFNFLCGMICERRVNGKMV